MMANSLESKRTLAYSNDPRWRMVWQSKVRGYKLRIYAPINIAPLPPSRVIEGKGRAFDFDLTPKLALYVGNLTARHTHVA